DQESRRNRVPGGRASPYLLTLPVGAQVRCTGPWGTFILDRAPEAEAVFIADGTGIAPIRPMLRRALATATRHPLRLLYGGESRERLLYRTELEAMAREHRDFHCEHVPSARLREEVARRWVDADADRARRFFICGVGAIGPALRDLSPRTSTAKRGAPARNPSTPSAGKAVRSLGAQHARATATACAESGDRLVPGRAPCHGSAHVLVDPPPRREPPAPARPRHVPARRRARRDPRLREPVDCRHGRGTRRLRGGRGGGRRHAPRAHRHGGHPGLPPRAPRARRRRRPGRAARARSLRPRPRRLERDHRRYLGRRALREAVRAHARDRHRAPPAARRRARQRPAEGGARRELPPRLGAAAAGADLR